MRAPDYDPFENLDVVGGTTWGLVDVGAIARGEVVELPPVMLEREDGACLIYAGKVHAINSESEAGKTWLALFACAQQMYAGAHVFYVDFEDSASGVVGRLLSMEVPPDLIATLFHYVRPDEPLQGAARLEFFAALDEHKPVLAVLDGVTEAMVMHGLSIKDNDDTARFMELMTRPIARTGSAVVALDHVTKEREGRRYAIGAQHKLAGVDGAVYAMDADKPFGRGMSGRSRLSVSKDRPGHVRPNAHGKTVALVEFIAGAEGAMEVRLLKPGQPPPGSAVAEATDDTTLLAVSAAVAAAGDWIATADVVRQVKKRPSAVRFGLTWLQGSGHVERRALGVGKATEYRHVKSYESSPEGGAS
jgi:hypothetical protein